VRSADGIELHYRVAGDGPAVILVHGWSCDQDFWRDQIAPLAERYRVVTLDLAGHGLSRADADARHWSMTGFAADVEAVADAVGAEPFAVLGHSMGGAVAVETALRVGARCRFLLGADTFNEALFYGARPAAEIAERRRFFEHDFAGAMRDMVGRITAPQADRAVVAWIEAAMSEIPEPALALRVLEALLAWDIAARWPKLTVPVATINSAMLTRARETLVLDGLDLHEMEGVGHFPMMEDPATFNALALSILRARLSSFLEPSP
jgi:pimeloyl-ACP methyl ester carboxylesterase